MKILSSSLTFAAVLALGCHAQSPTQEARNDRFECEAAAFAKLLPAGIDAADLVQRLYTGSASLESVLANVQATLPELENLTKALNACRAEALPAAASIPDAGTSAS